jgi:acyl phosphate:glycerol-3-phosphate acyltransferase
VDIRTLGSGNAGGTNALRTQGWKFALGTVVVDVGKGALAVWLARWGLQMADPRGSAMLLPVIAAMAGHVWPVFHGFRGGKGGATLVGGLLLAWPVALVPVLAVWLLSLIGTGYVGLSTVLAALALPVFAALTSGDPVRLGLSLAIAALVVFTHRGNLQRLRAGTEPRFERARLFHRARRAS